MGDKLTRDNKGCFVKGIIPWNKDKKVKSNTGKTHFKLKNIPWNKGISISDETKRKISDTLKGTHPSDEARVKMSANNNRHMLGKHLTKKAKELNSEKHKKLWQTSEYVSKQMKARGVTPNKTELWLQDFLNQLYPNEWKFVGDGQVIISGKCPDFINTNGQKKIIELFGDYWHRGENPQDRIDIFKPFGYKTLIIWEKELKDKKNLESKIYKFSEVL